MLKHIRAGTSIRRRTSGAAHFDLKGDQRVNQHPTSASQLTYADPRLRPGLRLPTLPWGDRFWSTLECLAAFAVGILLMSFFYAGRGGAAGSEIGVPGHDSFYHIKMAEMIPQTGLVKHFPWLKFVYFTDEGDEFVSHHYGFHMLMLPFVQTAKWMGHGALAGGRWAICTFFGLELALFYLLLRTGNVRWPWLWIALFVLMPHQFFMRHAFVRAISPAMVFMLLIVLLLFRNRYLWAGLAVALFTHLYLGAVPYAPVIVATFAAASVLGPRGDRRFPWKAVVATAVGWGLGVLTYPYLHGMLEFLKLQILGSGLSPDIEVGREWKPYEGVWWFAQMSGVLLTVWFVAIAARLRSGPPLDARGLTLLLISVVFLILTLKARRFVEYWPVFCLLSAAYASSPLLERLAKWYSSEGNGGSGRLDLVLRWSSYVIILFAACGFSALLFWDTRNAKLTIHTEAIRLLRNWQIWLALVIPLQIVLARALLRGSPALPRLGHALLALLAAVAVSAGTVTTAAAGLSEVQRSTRCRYDLAAIRGMMDFLKANSQAGDVIFTDDWDVFPVFFYHNSHNRYIVGLDPAFTNNRRPDLWARYVQISRGRTPTDTTYTPVGEVEGERERIQVRLEDIRDVFGARFVITDRDHQALANKLYAARDFAELVYPAGTFSQTRGAEYRVFRVRAPGEEYEPVSPEEVEKDGVIYLGDLDPLSIEQGWGEFAVDREVEGGALMLDGQRHSRGLGTHAPCDLRYAIPEGFDRFEATVGVDDSQGERGSVVVSVWLDEREAFRSRLLTGGSAPTRISLQVGGAGQISLRAEPTDDGMRFDHVDWGTARFVRAKP